VGACRHARACAAAAESATSQEERIGQRHGTIRLKVQMNTQPRRTTNWKRRLGVALLALPILALSTGAGCIVYEEQVDDDGGISSGPGHDPWNHDDDVSCSNENDCGAGETCEAGVCQMKRCGESYDSTAPLGKSRYFGTDGELAIISDKSFIDGFEAMDGKYINSWDLQGGAKVVDVAGGNLTGERPHTIAVALELSNIVKLKGPNGVYDLDIGIWPKALAAGDVDADGLDELVAFSADGAIAVCDVDIKSCKIANIDGAKGKDAAVADVDGDGYAEPVFLLEVGDKTELIAWNTDSEKTGQDKTVGWQLNFPARAISAGDVSGDGQAEIALLEDGGWWGWKDDKVHVFSPQSEQIIMSKNVTGHTRDIALGDRDSDEQVELAVLRDNQQLELIKAVDGKLATIGTFPITVGNEAQRISILDWNGDSASGKLVGNAELVAGQAVPVAVLMFPPYPHNATAGSELARAHVSLGNNETTSESLSDTVSLSVGMAVSFGGEYGIFKAKVGASLDKSVSVTKTVSKKQSVGSRYRIVADPDLHGSEYAAVVISCGCYHRYRYVTVDPANRIGGSGQTADIYIPVGGQTQLWSSKRYNAMAKAVGTLPIINVPIRVGEPSSYPAELQTLEGNPIPQEDLLFLQTPSFQASDVGDVAFWLVSGQTETNAVAQSTTIGVSSSLGIGPASVDANIGLGVTQGYSITVGKDSIFGGGVPPIPDDPSTPEDEFLLNRYTFQPTVYRQHYTDSAGEDAAYYVMHFAAWK